MGKKESGVVIIGAGIAGLIAAIELEKGGIHPTIYEASDRVGGRVKTDVMDGFRLDHGFQVLLTAYPEAQKYLDYSALDLKTFLPGAIIFNGHDSFQLNDPLRQPSSILRMIFSSVGTIGDKLKLWLLSNKLKRKSIEAIFAEKQKSTLQYLKDFGFSEQIIRNFFKPFFSGIFLEDQLVTSSRMFEFVFKMFSEGSAAIPANGMQAIPNQLFNQLKHTRIHFQHRVSGIGGQKIKFDNGEEVLAERIIIAADPYSILQGFADQDQSYHSVINLYFSTDSSIINIPLIGLVSKEGALINNFCYMTDASPSYAPGGKSLLSISVVKDIKMSDSALMEAVKKEFAQLTGVDGRKMEFLKMYKIKNALPILDDLSSAIDPSATRIQGHIFLAGDHLLNGSLNAAMGSGRAAALAALGIQG
jgi:protoporphyrinogen oxidase